MRRPLMLQALSFSSNDAATAAVVKASAVTLTNASSLTEARQLLFDLIPQNLLRPFSSFLTRRQCSHAERIVKVAKNATDHV